MSSRWVNAVMGLLLVCTGVAAQGTEQANGLAIGLCVFVLAFLAMGLPRLRRVKTLLGAWAVLSPFALGYRDDVAGWTVLLAGIVVVVASLWPDHAPTSHLPAAGRPLV